MKRVFGMMLIACITFVGCTKVESTQPENTQASNTQPANTQAENTQPANTQAKNTQATNTPAANTQAANTQTENAQTENKADPAVNNPQKDTPAGGFQDYIKSSKESEARTNLKLIANGAIAFYETEHYDEENDKVITESFPVSEGVQLGPDVNENTIDKNYQIADNEYDEVWKQLYFRLNSPAYYTYSYVSDGKKARIKAAASITEACDSIFELELSVSELGAISGPIKDISNTGDCSPAKL